jgi:Zn-dependent membrane protease YugP
MLFDPIYWIILIVCGLISGGAAMLTKSRFAWASKVPTRRNQTGADVARAILKANDIYDVEVVEHQGFLSDHYNPREKVLALSPQNFHGRSAAAAGIAAHEVGHAIQHAHAYAPLGMRSLLVPVANIGSNLGPWIIIAGIFLGMMQGSTAAEAGGLATILAWLGVGLFGAGTLFTLVTLPVEFDASARAKTQLQTIGLTASPEEDEAVAKVLNAAAMTYVAAAFSSLLMLLYWAWQAGLLGGRRE